MINKKIDVISDTYLKKSENNITQSIDNVKQTKMNITKVDEFNNSKISLNRKILSWEWYTEIKTFKLFIHCLLRANWVDKNYRGIIIKRGQFLTSVAKLSVETGLTFREVRTALKHLIATNELTKQAYSQYSIITVNKYNEYQTEFKKATSELTSERQASDKQATTNNNKNNKNNNDITTITTTNENEKTNFYGEYYNVFLTTKHYKELEVLIASKKKMQEIIDTLSVKIETGKENKYSEDLPNAHYERVKAYFNYILKNPKKFQDKKQSEEVPPDNNGYRKGSKRPPKSTRSFEEQYQRDMEIINGIRE